MSVKKLSKEKIQERAVFEGQVLHMRRNKLNIRPSELAKKLSCSHAAITSVENGRNPEGNIKSKMIEELFGSELNFKKRASQIKSYIREADPSYFESVEKFELVENGVAKSITTLNDIKIRKTIHGFFFNTDSKTFTDDEFYEQNNNFEKLILEIEHCLKQLENWQKLNSKIMRSETFHIDYNSKRNQKIELGGFAKAHKRQAKASDFDLRLKNLFTVNQLSYIEKKNFRVLNLQVFLIL